MSLSLGLGLALTRNKGVGFSLPAFMAGQSDGFWYDFSKTDRLFQENVGPTPADDPNEVIGLALSSRLWSGQTLADAIAAAPELVANGDFASADGWTAGGGWSISGGQAAAAASGSLTRAISVTPGRLYRISYEVVSRAAGTVTPNFSGGSTVSGPTSSTVGIKVCYLVAATGNATLGFTSAGSPVLAIDNVSVKEVSRYPATQATGSLKPKYQTTGAAFDGSDDNLLTGYMAGPGANFIVAKVKVPASVSAFQYISASIGAANTRFGIGINTDGVFGAGVGAVSPVSGGKSTSSDLRGQTVVVGVSFDGATIRAFAGSAQVLSTAQSGSANTDTPLRIGSLNTGFASDFFGGSIKNIVAGREFIDLATFNKIANAL